MKGSASLRVLPLRFSITHPLVLFYVAEGDTLCQFCKSGPFVVRNLSPESAPSNEESLEAEKTGKL